MITATVLDSQHAQLTTPTGVRDINHHDIRIGLVDVLRQEATTSGERIEALVEDRLDQKWLRLIVDASGTAHTEDHPRPYEPAGAPMANPPAPAAESLESLNTHGDDAPSVPRRRAQVGTLLTATPAVEPAQMGLRGWFTRLGIRMAPDATELARRADIHAVSQHWAGLNSIFVGNPKGGANKTPTVLMLGAVFARYGGAGVAVWDNNETCGTLPWRAEQGPHRATVIDLLSESDELLKPSAQAGDMARFLHHQPADRYDALFSDHAIDSDHVVTADEVDAIHRVLGRYYRMLFIDTGNNQRAENWRAALAHANQLVVPMVGREDTAEAAALMLDTLHGRDEHSQRLAQNAIAIVSQQTPHDQIDWIVDRFRPLVKEVVTIPHDPALKAGVIHYDALTAPTQRAWLHAAAAVARSL